jgi:hypothetical protein
MERLSFSQLPLAARVAVGVAFLNAWVSFEEFIVDRHGLWRYMPFYKVGEFCVWDLAVTLGIGVAIWRASGRRGCEE